VDNLRADPPIHSRETLSPSLPRFLDYEKSLACIHCGLCLSSCPTYLETGNENDSPRGRIYLMRAVQDGRLPLAGTGSGATAVRHLDLCLGCRACEAVCPSGVQYGQLLEATRAHVEKNYARSFWQAFLRRVAIEKIFPFPERMELALRPALWLKRLNAHRLLPKFLRDMLDLLPETLSREELPVQSPASGSFKSRPRGRVGFISGCVMQVLFGKTNAASVQLLNQAGFHVVTPEEQGCCGALYCHGGNLDEARACARRNIEAFERLELDAIIINAAGCGSTLKEYGHLLQEDPAWAKRAAAFSQKVKDLTEWLVNTGRAAELPLPERSARAEPPRNDPGLVTYHDACHLAHPQRITRPPRDLVRAVAKERFVELAEADVCCGSAGSYNLTEPEMAERLQRRKVENILKSGAHTVVTTNPGCLLQIRAGLRHAGATHIHAVHIADYLTQSRPPRD